MLTLEAASKSLAEELAGEFPSEVEFVISALEAGPRPEHDRQKTVRTRYRVKAVVKLFSDTPDTDPAVIYTRHVNENAVGFLSRNPLTLSHGGLLTIPGPRGVMLRVYSTVLRCRVAAPGWYEGALYFNRNQPVFSADNLT
jgi:hypothetical protein